MEEEEEAKPINDDLTCEKFFDAVDEFPFFDCIPNAESEFAESSNISHIQAVTESANSSKQISLNDSKNLKEVMQEITPRERKNKILSALKDHNKLQQARSDSPASEESSSVITSENWESPPNNFNETSSGILVFLAGLVVKAIGFQISLLFRFLTFPIWFSYVSYLFMLDPFGIFKRVKKRITDKLITVGGTVTQFLCQKLKGHKSIWNLAVKFGWGFFWSIYICFVLCGFLIGGFVVGGIMMKYTVEKPIRMTESLNFDYTQTSPVALVPIMSCSSASSGVDFQENVGDSTGSRFFPPGHKLQLTVSLTLPESDYNRNLGVFQVRVDFLSEKGEVSASSRHPCMLQFKSHVIRYVETLMKGVPLVAGYSSEAQVVKIKMRGFTEGYSRPTWCLRVIIEQRAEYKSGAGIPEIYEASLILESELGLFKRILWYWKTTIYIWISMVLSMVQLVLVLVCCRPVLIPRLRHRGGGSAQNTAAGAVSG